ncbi:hypothetical protein [Chryseobacterium sp. JAH]|uniref:hypothetical protein n=1 Tax=Chryseobacterium sp. JAH TaxID=1742858 RepID=UPI0007412169|nr:hypothetical protein [Chryseobacterium sp. JAH]KUJ49961.1 hypothetical protein AR685_17230 [Chryseobacterium sp. JAH]
MKNLVLVFTVFSSFIFAQQNKKMSLNLKDSTAVRNVNSILDYSKISFSNLNSDLTSSSDVNKNLDRLLINTINFNTVINNRAVTTVDAGTYYKPRIDGMDMLGRKIFSLQVYKLK